MKRTKLFDLSMDLIDLINKFNFCVSVPQKQQNAKFTVQDKFICIQLRVYGKLPNVGSNGIRYTHVSS